MLAHDVWHRPASRLHIRSDPTHASSLPHNVQLELEYVRNGGIKLLYSEVFVISDICCNVMAHITCQKVPPSE